MVRRVRKLLIGATLLSSHSKLLTSELADARLTVHSEVLNEWFRLIPQLIGQVTCPNISANIAVKNMQKLKYNTRAVG
ncbi:hypothetical protein EVAR_43543_1 [Eumeta japonica]|uniref:Uncharacterized protein n=1 Tax=Eumeta variegata TaxID=151549 RepID=A0A4C1WBJ0_EUMVA|nr:hypothetical protein EVAR_43543_1 [Eumeta japonica]